MFKIKRKNPTNYTKHALYLVALFSFVISLFTFDARDFFEYLFVLPLTFSVLNMVAARQNNTVSVSKVIVYLFMILRYALTPLIIYVEGYPLQNYFYVIDSYTGFYTIVIMVLEMMAIFLGISDRFQFKNFQTFSVEAVIGLFSNYNKIRIINRVLLFFLLIICYVYPQVFEGYGFVFTSDLIQLGDGGAASLSRLPYGVRFFSSVLLESFRFIILQYILLRISSNEKRQNQFRWCFLSFLLIAINQLLVSGRLMIGLIIGLAQYMELYVLFPKYRKIIKSFIVFAGTTFFFCVFVLYLGKLVQFTSLSNIIQAYTNGYYEVYQSQSAYYYYNAGFFKKIQMLFFNDGILNIAILSSIVPHTINSSDIYNYFIYNSSYNGGRVVPLISQTSYYFSVFGFIITFLIVRLSVCFELYAFNNRVLCYYISLFLAISPFMFNISIVIHAFTTIILPIILLSMLNRITIKL